MSYKVGEVLGKYTVTRDFDSANGGQCQWGFGEYNKKEFFIKKFLNPVYPGEKAPGSDKGKQKKRAQCDKFAKKQRALIKALAGYGDGGLVVKTRELLSHGNDFGKHYFKVTEKVDTSSLSDKVHTLEVQKKLFVLLTAAGAVNILHRSGIIHLDLKPDNILIQEYGGKLIAKVIDFDSSILEGESTEAETLVGDPVYYSPEFARHIAASVEEPPPTKKYDIFSLGLIFCKYWTGKLPTFPSSYNYAHEAVVEGEKLSVPNTSDGTVKSEKRKISRLSGTLIKSKATKTHPDSTNTDIQQLIQRILEADPKTRLCIKTVHESLKHLYHHGKLPKLDVDKPKTRLTFSKNLRR